MFYEKSQTFSVGRIPKKGPSCISGEIHLYMKIYRDEAETTSPFGHLTFRPSPDRGRGQALPDIQKQKMMPYITDEGDAVREDPGCGVLYSVLRGSAFKIKKLAEAER